MTTLSAITVATTFAVSLPVSASASSVVLFPTAPAQTAGFKPVDASASGDLAAGYWDNTSYDSVTQSAGGWGSACSAAAIVAGGTCDWRRPDLPAGYQNLTNPVTADPGSMQYYGMTDGGPTDTPENFYFTGPWAIDLAVLFQLSAWDDSVEFGWYEAGSPDKRTPLLPLAGTSPGPYSNNLGPTEPEGRASASIPSDFGFYYRNTRYGTSPTDEILFFTESRFNRIGNYFAYFSDPSSGLWMNTDLQFASAAPDDEFRGFAARINRQQFVLFTDSTNRYWLGLEDQIGGTTSAFCENRGLQPCSDYDHNDLIISITQSSSGCAHGQCAPPPPPVPEPSLPALAVSGAAGLAWLRRRRRQ